MKKLLVLVLFLACFSSLSRAKVDIFEFQFYAADITYPVNRPVMIGDTVQVDLWVKNLGTKDGSQTDYPGGDITLDFYYGLPGIEFATRQVHYQVTIPNVPKISYNSYKLLKTKFYIDPNKFKPDTTNIIIIWPNGDKILNKDSVTVDSNRTDRGYAILSILVKSDKTGIKNTGANSMFSVFPNPATNMLHITMNTSAKGILTLTDMAGKAVLTQPFEAAAGTQLNLPLNGDGNIREGVYFLSVQTATSKEVTRVFISK